MCRITLVLQDRLKSGKCAFVSQMDVILKNMLLLSFCVIECCSGSVIYFNFFINQLENVSQMTEIEFEENK